MIGDVRIFAVSFVTGLITSLTVSGAMIPKAALFALSALICLSGAFGFVLRGIVDEARKDRSEPEEWPQTGHDCNTCRYKDVSWREEPCEECCFEDVDRWEAI